MKLITRFELAAKSESEIYALLRKVFNKLARSESDIAVYVCYLDNMPQRIITPIFKTKNHIAHWFN